VRWHKARKGLYCGRAEQILHDFVATYHPGRADKKLYEAELARAFAALSKCRIPGLAAQVMGVLGVLVAESH